MINFESVQQALGYIFDNKPLIVINIPNSKYNWCLVDEIRNILEVNVDNYDLTKRLEFRDQVIAVLNLSYLRENKTLLTNCQVCSYLSQLAVNTPTVMIISEPGLYELLVRSRMPKAKPFREWLFFTVLPTLRANPDLVQQINDLSYELDNSRSMCNLYREEAIDLRKRYNNMVRKFNILNSITDSTRRDGKLDHDKFIRSMIAYERTNPKIEMCHLRESKGNRFTNRNRHSIYKRNSLFHRGNLCGYIGA